MNLKRLTLHLFCLTLLPVLGYGQVGNPAPNFTATDTHGDTHTLYDYLDQGKVVVLDFFYTTCVPCQFYTPQVNLANDKYGCEEGPVVFLGIDYDDTDAQVIAYDNTYDIEYPSISGIEGGGNSIVQQYGVLGFPTFYVIDSSKTIVADIYPPTLQVFDFDFAQLGISPDACTVSSITQASNFRKLTVYPNPLQGNQLQLRLPSSASGPATVEVIEFTGRRIYTASLKLPMQDEIELPNSTNQSGLYLVKVVLEEEGVVYTGTFIRY